MGKVKSPAMPCAVWHYEIFTFHEILASCIEFVASQADDDEIGDDEIGSRDTAQAKARASASASPFDKVCKKEVRSPPDVLRWRLFFAKKCRESYV